MDWEINGPLPFTTREQWLEGFPKLTRENEQVLSVWHFCRGWDPALAPVAAAYYGVDDLDFLMTQLLVIRDRKAEHEAARARAAGG